MSADSRKSRGMRAQVLSADFLRPIFAWVTTVGASASGRDLKNTPGLAVEVKARRNFEPLAWLKQAWKNSDDDEMSIVIWQPDGYGPTSMKRWPYMGYLGDFRKLWAELQMLRDYVMDKDPDYYRLVLKARDDLDG